jgi:hypothetical protein
MRRSVQQNLGSGCGLTQTHEKETAILAGNREFPEARFGEKRQVGLLDNKYLLFQMGIPPEGVASLINIHFLSILGG